MPRNPFGDEASRPERMNPFGDDAAETRSEAIGRIEHAARKIRGLRTQLGAEGLTLSATRELIDAVSSALDAAARVLRDVGDQ